MQAFWGGEEEEGLCRKGFRFAAEADPQRSAILGVFSASRAAFPFAFKFPPQDAQRFFLDT